MQGIATQSNPCATQGATCLPSDLQSIVDAWGDLPDSLRQGIVAMVRASVER
jgi:hypothetical protein